MITMDFVDGLPQSSKFNCLLVIVDKRTKFSYFLPLAHPYTMAKVAQLYMHQIYKFLQDSWVPRLDHLGQGSDLH